MPVSNPFAYVAPTLTTIARHKGITMQWRDSAATIQSTIQDANGSPMGEHYSAVNKACADFYGLLQKVCPPSGDRDAAERSIRLARMKANEAMRPTENREGWAQRMAEQVTQHLWDAKLLASMSIALALPEELPAWEAAQ